MSNAQWVGFIFLVIAVVYWILQRHANEEPSGFRLDGDVPEDLAGCAVLQKEIGIRCTSPVALKGKPDALFLNRQGVVIPVEVKSRYRARVYDSDIIQLSSYKVMIENSKSRHQVGDHGYLRIVTPEGSIYKKVRLMGTESIRYLHDRYWMIVRGQIPFEALKCHGNDGVCRKCAYVKECQGG